MSDYIKRKQGLQQLVIIMYDGVLGYSELSKVTQIDGTVIGFEDKVWSRKDCSKYLGQLTEIATVCVILPPSLKSSIVSAIVSQSFSPDVTRRVHFYQIQSTSKSLLYPSLITLDEVFLDLNQRVSMPLDTSPLIVGSFLQEFDNQNTVEAYFSKPHDHQIVSGLCVRSDRSIGPQGNFAPTYLMVQHMRLDGEGIISTRPKGYTF